MIGDKVLEMMDEDAEDRRKIMMSEKKVLIPCPKGRVGCTVAHYKIVPRGDDDERLLRQIESLDEHEASLEITWYDDPSPIPMDIAALKELAARAVRMDKELDLVHGCLTDIYGDATKDRIRQCLDAIEELDK